ncbi:MAG: hypothetical protein PUE26_09910 [Ruminococcus sp.]|nr:hypothetical protein [Ruminococcus sp.]MDD6710438.1 hypothetical protein [Ruminococcus sp.]
MKKLFYFLIPILTFFGIQTVNAAYLAPTWLDLTVTNDHNPQSINFPNPVWENAGRGYVLGSISLSRPNNKPAVVTSIYLHSDTFYTCEIINTTQKSLQQTDGSYVDFDVYSLKCPVILASNGLDYMSIVYQNNHQVTATIRGMWGFVSEEYTNEQLNTIISILQDTSSTSEIAGKLDEVNKSITESNKKIDEVKDNINNSDVSGANSDLNNFTNNELFKDSTGILSIIQAPINMLNSITSSTCSPLSLPIPYMNFNIDIPCLSTVFSKHLSKELLTLLKLAINGLIIYKVLCSLVMDIHSYKDPDSDRLEVLDL